MSRHQNLLTGLLLSFAIVLCSAIYWPGLSGGFVFDDFPNIVDNQGVQPEHATIASLARAALSSPSSELKRPLSSLTFAANYLAVGHDPYWYKVTNLALHLANGILVFLLSLQVLACTLPFASLRRRHVASLAVAAAWMLLPINLTAVLYVVQRMESLANVFVLAGLIAYIANRRRGRTPWAMTTLCAATVLGTLAKETAVMLPLYALVAEFTILRSNESPMPQGTKRALVIFYLAVLVLPGAIGAVWLLPKVLDPQTWLSRDFGLQERLLSELRVVASYVQWTLVPTPHALSFYHDDFKPSISLLTPWTTLASGLFIGSLAVAAWAARAKYPLQSFGIGLFLASNLLTATVLPLELIYEHRNYFPSVGLLFAVAPWLCALPQRQEHDPALPLARYALMAGLLVLWGAQTAITAQAWGEPLRLAAELAWRATDSPRAQYELGRTYVIYSRYDPASPYTPLAYAPLERSAAIPGSTILAEQALIFFNSRLHRPIEAAWWGSMQRKMLARPAGVQDESSLEALSRCLIDQRCDLPVDRLKATFDAAMHQPHPSPRLMAIYGDFAWNALDDRPLALSLLGRAVDGAPGEAAYLITLARMHLALGQFYEAGSLVSRLGTLNHAGSLDTDIDKLRQQLAHASTIDDGE